MTVPRCKGESCKFPYESGKGVKVSSLLPTEKYIVKHAAYKKDYFTPAEIVNASRGRGVCSNRTLGYLYSYCKITFGNYLKHVIKDKKVHQTIRRNVLNHNYCDPKYIHCDAEIKLEHSDLLPLTDAEYGDVRVLRSAVYAYGQLKGDYQGLFDPLRNKDSLVRIMAISACGESECPPKIFISFIDKYKWSYVGQSVAVRSYAEAGWPAGDLPLSYLKDEVVLKSLYDGYRSVMKSRSCQRRGLEEFCGVINEHREDLMPYIKLSGIQCRGYLKQKLGTSF